MTLKKVLLLVTLSFALNCCPPFFLINATSETSLFETGQEIDAKKTPVEPDLVGQTFWFAPNIKRDRLLRLGFLKTMKDSHLLDSERIYPKTVMKINIVEKTSEDYRNFYRIIFPDGSIAYLETDKIEYDISEYTSKSIKSKSKDDMYIVSVESDLFGTYGLDEYKDEKFFKENPDNLKSVVLSINKANKIASEKAYKKRMARGGVSVGMTMKQVRSSNWGRPLSINKTIVNGVISEQWVYPSNSYLYFNNGILSGIQKKE